MEVRDERRPDHASAHSMAAAGREHPQPGPRVHVEVLERRTVCGRKSERNHQTSNWDDVNCSECTAAASRRGHPLMLQRRHDSDVTMFDGYCGAGGSSAGAVATGCVRVTMAVNHWPLTIETHNTNHPDTDHDRADINKADPRRYPRQRRHPQHRPRRDRRLRRIARLHTVRRHYDLVA